LRFDGLSPQDRALWHMVLVCLEREDIAAARRFIGMMTDAEARELRLRFIAPSLLPGPHDNVALRAAFLR
jgi:hypothetical protein